MIRFSTTIIHWLFFLALIASRGILFGLNPQALTFSHYGTNHGLLDVYVKCFMEDADGYLWLGTVHQGVGRFDGYEFKMYNREGNKNNPFFSNAVNSILEDSNGNIWVGTTEGLNLYNSIHDRFDVFPILDGRNTDITSMLEDSHGNLWVCAGNRLVSINVDSHEVIDYFDRLRLLGLDVNYDYIYTLQILPPNRLVLGLSGSHMLIFDYLHDEGQLIPYPRGVFVDNNNIILRQMIRSSSGEIYIPFWGSGVYKLDEAGNRIVDAFTPLLNNPYVNSIFEYEPDVFLVATDGGGLNIIDTNSGTASYSLHDRKNPSSLSSNKLFSIFYSSTGQLWISSTISNLNIYDPTQNKFTTISSVPTNPRSLSHQAVLCFLEDSKGRLWIGTESGGLNLMVEEDHFISYKHNPTNPNSIGGNTVISLLEDSKGLIWVGTWTGGLNLFNPENGTFKRFQHNPDDVTSISASNVFDIVETKPGELWIATLAGLNLMDTKSGTFKRFKHNPSDRNSISTDFLFSLNHDGNNRLLIGTAGAGFVIYDIEKKVFTNYNQNDPSNPGLNSNHINQIHVGETGQIWLATDNGVCQFLIEKNRFETYASNDGLPSNSIRAIAQDAKGNLWLSTLSGVSSINPQTGEMSNYSMHDGLQGNSFNRSSVVRTRSGHIYFGGENGFNRFHPDDIQTNPYPPKVILTELLINGQRINQGEMLDGKVLFDKRLSETQRIVLKYGKQSVTFNFTGIHFASPLNNRFAYRLSNWVDEWVYTNSISRSATFINLRPGTYIFQVIAANSDGVWNTEGKSITLVVLPPWWATWWATMLYIIFFSLVLLVSRMLVRKNLGYQHAISLEKLKNEKMKELFEKDKEIDRLNLVMFTNISHEFRTPLTLISGPLENLIKNVKDFNIREDLKLVYRNARRLLVLVNELLDIRQVNLGRYPVKPEKLDLIAFLNDYFQSFNLLANQKRISFRFNTRLSTLTCCVDRDIVEKIVYNILGNAFKFTPDGGSITLGLQADREIVSIYVEDNGVGIAQEDIPRIFERFFQTHSTSTKNNVQGSGIGLSLAKDLAKLLDGDIVVESALGVGSTFCLSFPIQLQSESSEEVVAYTQVNHTVQDINTSQFSTLEDEEELFNDILLEPGKKTILIVEDNPDMRLFIYKSFSDDFNVIRSSDGKDGLVKAIAFMPDLILSDVMMPVVDGIALCSEIKSDIRINHIPVVLLTAKVADDLHIEGLEKGADAYINKPFSIDILRACMQSLMDNRQRLRDYYSKNIGYEKFALEDTNPDKGFLMKAIKTIEKNIDNSYLGVDQFASELGMGRTTFYKKIKAVSGYTANDLIKLIRLKRAAALIKGTSKSISEIYFETGFNDGSYFAQCFQKQYGVLPSEYRDRVE